MSKLADKLANLLRLATLKPGEEGNEARVNEARTASFLLVKTCQDNGVTLSFKLPRQEQAAAPPRRPEGVYSGGMKNGQNIDFGDFFSWVREAHGQRQQPFKRPRAHQPPRTPPHRENEVYQTTFHNRAQATYRCPACKVPINEAEHVWMRRVDDRGRATHILCGTEALFAEPGQRADYTKPESPFARAARMERDDGE